MVNGRNNRPMKIIGVSTAMLRANAIFTFKRHGVLDRYKKAKNLFSINAAACWLFSLVDSL
jgi:hypothetical protein